MLLIGRVKGSYFVETVGCFWKFASFGVELGKSQPGGGVLGVPKDKAFVVLFRLFEVKCEFILLSQSFDFVRLVFLECGLELLGWLLDLVLDLIRKVFMDEVWVLGHDCIGSCLNLAEEVGVQLWDEVGLLFGGETIFGDCFAVLIGHDSIDRLSELVFKLLVAFVGAELELVDVLSLAFVDQLFGDLLDDDRGFGVWDAFLGLWRLVESLVFLGDFVDVLLNDDSEASSCVWGGSEFAYLGVDLWIDGLIEFISLDSLFKIIVSLRILVFL